MMVAEEKRTGSLTINFSQGYVAGTIEWRERIPAKDLKDLGEDQ